MIKLSQNYRLPKTVRIVKTDDFGKILRSTVNTHLTLGRDAVSIGAIQTQTPGRVRFGFTVGKHNVPRSVDRALAKRVLREVARHTLPEIKALCIDKQIGLDINLRVRCPLGRVGTELSVKEAKSLLFLSTQKCIAAFIKRVVAINKEIASVG